MIDFTGYRPFSLAAFATALTPGIYQPDQLIFACQMRHLGFADARPVSAGAVALAGWLVRNADFVDAPKPGTHPLNSGTVIERILAGDVLPDEAFAIELAQATEGAVLPDMFGLPRASTEFPHFARSTPFAGSPPFAESPPFASSTGPEDFAPAPQGPVEKTPLSAPVHPSSGAAAASSLEETLPPLGVLGGSLPGGRLFRPLADSRLPHGFLIAGAGVMLSLDESTAVAMRDTIEEGLAYIRQQRASGRRQAA